jgi:hypothetical protein
VKRIELLEHAIPIAGCISADHIQEHRFMRALIDVQLNAVLPRTEAAIEEARALIEQYGPPHVVECATLDLGSE